MKKLLKVKTTPFDAADYLTTPEARAAYLEACLEEAPGNVAFFALALGDVARSLGMSRVAKKAGIPRESLYRSLSQAGNPELSTLLRVATALGVRLSFKPAEPRSRRPLKAARATSRVRGSRLVASA